MKFYPHGAKTSRMRGVLEMQGENLEGEGWRHDHYSFAATSDAASW
jgi:hypothetical protein